MGKPESIPSHKTNKPMRGRLTLKARMFERLCEKEMCWASPNQPQVTRRTNTREEGLHTRHESSNAFVKRRGAWGSLNQSIITRRTNAREELTHRRHKCLNAFVKRRGAWASPNQPLVTRRTNAREEGLHTDTQGKGLLTHTRDKVSNAFVKREVHGQARTLPCHKSHEHTSKIYTNTQDTKV